MTWGEQTDVPESADWYNSSYIIVGLKRQNAYARMPTYRSAPQRNKTVAITPDFSEVAVFERSMVSAKTRHRQRWRWQWDTLS